MSDPEATRREDERVKNFIYAHWFHNAFPPPGRFAYPPPGYCRFVEFSTMEIARLQKEHDDRTDLHHLRNGGPHDR